MNKERIKHRKQTTEKETVEEGCKGRKKSGGTKQERVWKRREAGRGREWRCWSNFINQSGRGTTRGVRAGYQVSGRLKLFCLHKGGKRP